MWVRIIYFLCCFDIDINRMFSIYTFKSNPSSKITIYLSLLSVNIFEIFLFNYFLLGQIYWFFCSFFPISIYRLPVRSILWIVPLHLLVLLWIVWIVYWLLIHVVAVTLDIKVRNSYFYRYYFYHFRMLLT